MNRQANGREETHQCRSSSLDGDKDIIASKPPLEFFKAMFLYRSSVR